MRRIAARLCLLDACDRAQAAADANPGFEDLHHFSGSHDGEHVGADRETTTQTPCEGDCGFGGEGEQEDTASAPSACEDHLQAAFKKYETLLVAGLCLCRTMIEQMSFCCCSLSPNGLVVRKPACHPNVEMPAKLTTASPPRTNGPEEKRECCPSDRKISTTTLQAQNLGQKEKHGCCKNDDKVVTASQNNTLGHGQEKENGCCTHDEKIPMTGKANRLDHGDEEKPGCCTDDQKTATAEVTNALSHGDEKKHGCCAHDEEIATKGEIIGSPVTATDKLDIEKAAAREHVLLNVAGMDCSGCANKVTNFLRRVPGLSNPNVVFVSGTVEFDLDAKVIQMDALLPQLEKATGYNFTPLSSGYQTLDLLMSSIIADTLAGANIDGIVDVAREKQAGVYRVTYNSRVIGARSVLPPGARLAPPKKDVGLSEGTRRMWRIIWMLIAAAVFTIPVVVLNWSEAPIPSSTRQIISFVLATLVQVIAVPEFYIGAWKTLRYSRLVDMDMLVVISITAAYFYSIVAFGLTEAGYDLEQEPFFETSSLLITLILLGRLVAAFARVKAVSAVSLRSLQVDTAYLLDKVGGDREVDARLLEIGDKVKILPHSKIVTDGTIVLGETSIDESMITGEAIPVSKHVGDPVIGGTLNQTGSIQITITRLPGKNSITDIANLVENAVGQKPRIQDLADRFAAWLIPAVVTAALISLIVWLVVSIQVRGSSAGGAVGISITYAIAVIAVSCPCALGLAVPMVLVIAGGVAAKAGVIVKTADATERSFKVTDVVFDKTGTLTTGKLKVLSEELFGGVSDAESRSLAHALAEGNQHPVSVAVAEYLTEHATASAELEDIQTVPGAGVQARWKGSVIKAGNPYWLAIDDHPCMAGALAKTTFCLTVDDEPVLVYSLLSTIRAEACNVVAELRQRKITCHVVSGDAPHAVQEVAAALGIKPTNTVSRSSPASKQQYIEALQSQGKVTLFCGDGTNDAVAVAQANVGVQIGSASDVTESVADVVLLGGLEGVVRLLDISQRSFSRIRFNFVWAGLYNVFAVLLASGAFVKVRIPPGYAGLGEIVSVVPVVATAATLQLKKRKGWAL